MLEILNVFLPRVAAYACLLSGTLSAIVYTPCSGAAKINLDRAIAAAQNTDPWLQASVYRQTSLEAQSVSAGRLPDPTLSFGYANLPTDTFDLRQEPMTMLKFDMNQKFPRGRSLSLHKEKLHTLSEVEINARQNRLALTALKVAELWLDAYRYEKSINLIEKDRNLFEHLVDVAESNYTSARGRTRQHDLLRAQLELTALDDRLQSLKHLRDTHIANLSEWLYNDAVADGINSQADIEIDIQSLSSEALAPPELILRRESEDKQQRLMALLNAHPKILIIQKQLAAEDKNIALSRQNYKPQWGINASYGIREADNNGVERADFLSLAVTVDLPIFTSKRQDKLLQSAMAEKERVVSERALLVRQLLASYRLAESAYFNLTKRKSLYDERLLPEVAQQADAALAAYTHDDGDFSEVVRARISELNANIEALNINVEKYKSLAQLRYLLVAENEK